MDLKSEQIKMTQYWEEQLKAMPYLTSKCHDIPIIFFDFEPLLLEAEGPFELAPDWQLLPPRDKISSPS